MISLLPLPLRTDARRAGIALAALFVSSFPVKAAEGPIGTWLVEQGWANVKIENCNDRLWGIVAWEKKANVDSKNPDAAKRTRPTLGMPILLGMKPTEANRWEGEIYNSQDGKTYSANISLKSPDVLRVEGCVLGFLCGGQDWTRVKNADAGVAGTTGTAPKPRAATTTTGTTAAKPHSKTNAMAANAAAATATTAPDVCAVAASEMAATTPSNSRR